MFVKDHPPFIVHRAFLIKVPFFEACLGGQFEEGLNRKISLPDDSIDAFKDFLGYLYLGKSALDKYSKFHNQDDQTGVLSVLDLYGLAEKFSYEDLQNDIMDLMIDIARDAGYGAMRPDFLDKLERSGRLIIPLHCHMSRLWCTSYAHMIKVQGLHGCDEKQALVWVRGGGDRVAEVFQMMMAKEELKRVTLGLRCRWHVHSITSTCAQLAEANALVKQETAAASW